MFWKRKDGIKSKCFALIVVKNKAIKRAWCIGKLQKDRYHWYVLKLKWPKAVELAYLEANKQETKYRSWF